MINMIVIRFRRVITAISAPTNAFGLITKLLYIVSIIVVVIIIIIIEYFISYLYH